MTLRSTLSDSRLPVTPSEDKPTGAVASPPSPSSEGNRESAHWRHPDVDPETGRIRPISAEAWQARQEELTRRLAEIDAEDDAPDEVYDEFMRNTDEERRRQGRPPAFEGCY
jgi:hypothetical protein